MVRMLGSRIVCLVALSMITACVEPQQEQPQLEESAAETSTQPAQAQTGDFDGRWVGSGSNARAAFRNRCGNGPLVDLTIQDGSARAVFSFTVRRRTDRRPRREVLSLSGAVEGQGKLVLSGFQSEAMAVLSASGEPSDGTWDTRRLACHGTFRVRRKS
jgi:hypothetical protein